MGQALKLSTEEKAIDLFMDPSRANMRTPVTVIDILTQDLKAWGEAEIKGGKDPKEIGKIVSSVKEDISEQVFKARSKAIDKRLIKKQERKG